MRTSFNNRNGKKVSAGYQNNKKTNGGNRNGACVSKTINVDASSHPFFRKSFVIGGAYEEAYRIQKAIKKSQA